MIEFSQTIRAVISCNKPNLSYSKADASSRTSCWKFAWRKMTAGGPAAKTQYNNYEAVFNDSQQGDHLELPLISLKALNFIINNLMDKKVEFKLSALET